MPPACADCDSFNHHQMSALIGRVLEVDKFEQVSGGGHQISLAGGPRQRGRGPFIRCCGGGLLAFSRINLMLRTRTSFGFIFYCNKLKPLKYKLTAELLQQETLIRFKFHT